MASTAFVADPRYLWGQVCEQPFDAVPTRVTHELNLIRLRGLPGLTRRELDTFFATVNAKARTAAVFHRKGAASTHRDTIMFLVMPGWGTRRTETAGLPGLRQATPAGREGRRRHRLLPLLGPTNRRGLLTLQPRPATRQPSQRSALPAGPPHDRRSIAPAAAAANPAALIRVNSRSLAAAWCTAATASSGRTATSSATRTHHYRRRSPLLSLRRTTARDQRGLIVAVRTQRPRRGPVLRLYASWAVDRAACADQCTECTWEISRSSMSAMCRGSRRGALR